MGRIFPPNSFVHRPVGFRGRTTTGRCSGGSTTRKCRVWQRSFTAVTIPPSCWRANCNFQEFSVARMRGGRFSRRSAEVERAGGTRAGADLEGNQGHRHDAAGGADREGFKVVEEVQPGRSHGRTIGRRSRSVRVRKLGLQNVQDGDPVAGGQGDQRADLLRGQLIRPEADRLAGGSEFAGRDA